MRLLPILLLLSACHESATKPMDDASGPVRDAKVVDAYPDAPPTPAIDWANYGNDCQRGWYGATTCTARDGVTKGLCILTSVPPSSGVNTGACRHYCFSNPPYTKECPPDGHPVQDGYYSQGCHCAQN